MASHKINFTKATLEKAPNAEKGKRDYYYDTNEKGLVMQVTGAGSKTFYLYKRVDGRPERILLGKFPDISVENARTFALKNKGAIAHGKNPQEERREVREEMTLKELFELYMTRYSNLHKKSWKYDEREINKYLSHWFNRRLSHIKRDDIFKLHAKIGTENGKYQANRILERLRAMYNKAIEWGYEGNNPADKIKKFREKSRDRFLQPDELPRFFEALEEEQNDSARDFIKMCLFTGARRSNVITMKWNEISFDFGTWRIEETKNGDPLTLPLTEMAMEVLLERKKDAISEWVFPSPKDDRQHLNDPKRAWRRLCDSAELEDLRIHDLRRTMGSYQASTGANAYVIQKSLGHKSPQSTEVYARLNLDPVRASVNKATNAMLAFVNKGEDSNGQPL